MADNKVPDFKDIDKALEDVYSGNLGYKRRNEVTTILNNTLKVYKKNTEHQYHKAARQGLQHLKSDTHILSVILKHPIVSTVLATLISLLIIKMATDIFS